MEKNISVHIPKFEYCTDNLYYDKPLAIISLKKILQNILLHLQLD